MISPEKISDCIGYLRTNEYRFSPMTDKIQRSIIRSFERGLDLLQPDQVTSIQHKIYGLWLDVRNMTTDSPLRSIQHDDVVEGIVGALEIAGVIESARPGGLKRFRDRVVKTAYHRSSGASIGKLSLAYLDTQEQEFRQAKSKTRRKGIKETADELLNISAGIRAELTRLGLVDTREITASEDIPYEPKSLDILQSLIKADVLFEGLIGFTSLDKIIQKLGFTKKYSRTAGVWD